MSNITQVVFTDKNMTTFKKGVKATGMDQVLSSKGPYTLFAPSDLAFGKMDSATIENLLQPENKTKLTDLIHQHVVEGKIDYKDLKNGDSLKTLNGNHLSVRVNNGEATIDGITIANRDLKSSNGVIHSLDTLLKN